MTLVLVCAPTAIAEPSIQLFFRDGLIWLSATGVSRQRILEEWSTVGGAVFIAADGIEGAPTSIELAGVPEREALDILLRGAAGYAAVARPSGSSATSRFARVHILPRSTLIAPPEPARERRVSMPVADVLPEGLAEVVRSGLTGVEPAEPLSDATPPSPSSSFAPGLAEAMKAIATPTSSSSVP